MEEVEKLKIKMKKIVLLVIIIVIIQTVDKTLLVSTPEAFFLFWVQKVCT